MQARAFRTVQISSKKLAKRRAALAGATSLLVGLTGPAVWANTVTSVWSGQSDSTWSNAGNWDANGPPSTAIGAEFSSPFTNQPNLTANATTNGLWMTTGVAQNVTITASSSYVLTLGYTVSPTLGTSSTTADLLMDDTAGDTLTAGPTVALKFGHNNGILSINDGDTMVVAGSIYTTNGNGPVFTGDATGTLDVTGNLMSGGGGGINLNNLTMILEQNNTSVLAGITLNANALLRLNAAGAIPAGETASANATGTTIQMRTDSSTAFTGNYAFGSSTLNLDKLTSAGGNNTVTLNGTVTVNTGSTFNLTTGDGDNLAITGPLHVGGGYTSTSALNPSLTTMTISGTVSPGTNYNHNGTQYLNLAGNTTGNSISGNIGDSIPTSTTLTPQTLSLQKSNTSTWMLSGTNNYSGTTAISGGKLLIDGDSSGATGTTTVSNSGTLAGNGTVGGNTTVSSGGTLAPGDGTGVLTFIQSLTMATGATASFSGNELAAIDQSLTFANGWKLSLNSGFEDGGSVTLFTFGTAGTLNLTPTINESNLGFTPSATLYLSQDGNSIVLNGISDVPEPGTLGLLALGSLGFLRRRRGRRTVENA